MLRCEAEVMDVIDAMLMEDEELMAELEAQLYDEVETYTEDMFESEADWDDFNICSIIDDYVFYHLSLTEILDNYNYTYTVHKYKDMWNENRRVITINATENENIHWLRKAFTQLAYTAYYSEQKKQNSFEFSRIKVYINY